METVQKENVKEARIKKKFNRTHYSLAISHGFYNVIQVFVSTFLISHIYSISTNYVLDIGLFYFGNYFTMAFTYLVVSILIDRTNRVSFYRVANLIKSVFIICVVFVGNKLATISVLAGALNGFSDGLYWTSYNVMKNELIPNSKMKTYSTIQLMVESSVNLIVPVVLGKIIEVESFKSSAIIILVITIVQLVSSIFIKSRRPEGSKFDFKGFVSHIRSLGDRGKMITHNIINAGLYGALEILTPINVIIIMIGYSSNFSLGLFTSIASVLAMLYLCWLNFMTKPGRRNVEYVLSSILPLIFAVLMVLDLNKVTIVLFSFAYGICNIFRKHVFDVSRNRILKKLDLYDDIVEYQCAIEFVMEMARSLVFVIMILAGAIGSVWGNEGILVSLKCLMVFGAFMFAVMNLSLYRYEKKVIDLDLM